MDNTSQDACPEVQDFTSKQGNVSKVLCLNPEDKYPYSFGVQKAKLILANIEAIQDFVSEYGGK
jgi:hypothetical protein